MIDEEFRKHDIKDYYEMNKDKFNKLVGEFNESDDMILFSNMFALMVRMMRVSGMSFEYIERFFQLENRTNIRDVYQFTELLTIYKKSEENSKKNNIASKNGIM